MSIVFTLHIEKIRQNCFWDWEVVNQWPVYTTVYPHPLCIQPDYSYRLLTKFEDVNTLQEATLKHATCTAMYIPAAIDTIITDVGDFFSDSLYERQQNCRGNLESDLKYLSYRAKVYDEYAEFHVRIPPLELSPCDVFQLPTCTICNTMTDNEFCREVLEIDGHSYYYVPFGDEFYDVEDIAFEFELDEELEFVYKNLPLNIYMEELHFVPTKKSK